MALICDASGVYALYDANDAQHAAVVSLVESEPGPLLLPIILLAEIDYLFHLPSRPKRSLGVYRGGRTRRLHADSTHWR